MRLSSQGPIADKRCRQCGQLFIHACDNCQTKLPETFNSAHYFASTRPINPPHRPEYCPECGSAFPWAGEALTNNKIESIWDLLHPTVVKMARMRFENGHYADAVESAFKELNATVKKIYLTKTGEELDGVRLMRKAFAHENPVIVLGDLSSETGRNIQQGYMDIFAGAISGIRNPKAHSNVEIDEARALHHLFVASLLFCKLDEIHN